jgi:hypothetical protein
MGTQDSAVVQPDGGMRDTDGVPPSRDGRSVTLAFETGLPVTDRHCGRCQKAFAGDPTLFFQNEWTLCPECEEILLPRQPNRPSTTHGGDLPGLREPTGL